MSNHVKIKQDLLGQLITSITGIDGTTDNAHYQNLVQTCTRIAQKTHISTDRDYILDHYNGLIEKFRIKNRDDLAERLSASMLVVTEASRQSYDVTQVLSLLEMLSRDPLQQELPEFISHSGTNSNTGNEITWRSILDEEPLVGKHWEELDYEDPMASSEGDDSGNEGLKLFDTITRQDPRCGYPEIEIEDRENPPRDIEFYSKEYDPLEIEILKSRPCYWDEHSLNSSLSSPITTKSMMTEFDVVRDILFMMSGTSSYLFDYKLSNGFCKVNVHGHYMRSGSSYKDRLCLSHLTQGILFGNNGTDTGFLYQFATLGTVIGKLRQFTDDDFLQRNFKGLKYEYLFGLLEVLVKQVSDNIVCVETSYLNGDIEVVSLLALHAKLSGIISPYIPLTNLLCEVADYANSAVSSKNLKIVILNRIYERACLLQASGSVDDYQVFINLFGKLAQEYIRETFEFIYYGNNEESVFITPLKDMASGDNDKSPKFTYDKDLVPEFLSESRDIVLLLVTRIQLYKYLSKTDYNQVTNNSTFTHEHVSSFFASLPFSNGLSSTPSHFSYLNLSARVESFFYDSFLSLYHYHSSELGNYLKRINACEGLSDVISIYFNLKLVPVLNDVIALLFHSALGKRQTGEENGMKSWTSWRDKAESNTFANEIWNGYTDMLSQSSSPSLDLSLPFSIVPYKAQESIDIKLELVPSAIKYLLNQTLTVKAPRYVVALLDLIYSDNGLDESDKKVTHGPLLLYQRTWTYLLLVRYCDNVLPYTSSFGLKDMSSLFFQLKVITNSILSFLNLVLLKEGRWVIDNISNVISSGFSSSLNGEIRNGHSPDDEEELVNLVALFGTESSKFGGLIVSFACICESISLSFEYHNTVSESHLHALQQNITEIKTFIPGTSLAL